MIPLYIPYYNRRDLLDKAVASASDCDDVEVLIINNSLEDVSLPCIKTIIPPFQMRFGHAQNMIWGIAKSLGHKFWLSMHTDAEAGPGSVRRLHDMALSYCLAGRKWGVIFTNYDALCAISTEAFSSIGGWDTNIPTYFGDCDLHYRLKLFGYENIDTDIPVVHHGSESIKSDPKTKFISDLMTTYAHDYYLKKWGGKPGEERFIIPFGREDLFGGSKQ